MPTLYLTLQTRHGQPRPFPLEKLRAYAARIAARESLRERKRRERTRNRKAPKLHDRRPSVIVVGAGFAGLSAAYELDRRGFDVSVYEARDRVGGRVWSLRNLVPGRTMEGGGELIGSNHTRWLLYAHRFKLRHKFTKVLEYENAPVHLNGRTLTFDQSKVLWKEFDRLTRKLSNVAKRVNAQRPWLSRGAKALDAHSLSWWLARQQRLRRKDHKPVYSNDCIAALRQQLVSDNGVEAGDQSLLGILAMVKGDGPGRYWDDTEKFRCGGGNDQLARHFQWALNRKNRRVFTNAVVTRIDSVTDSRTKRSVAMVTVRRRGKSENKTTDHVVLTAPPSVWSEIRSSDVELRRILSKPPRMGRNIKFLMGLRERPWRSYGGAPSSTSDTAVNDTWETTETLRQPQFGFVAFSGARDADECSDGQGRARRQRLLAALAPLYPTLATEVGRTRFMNWQQERWSRASYYFARCGDVTKYGELWAQGYGGWFHFAGEHTSFAFPGYMEGALRSGYRVAEQLSQLHGMW